MKEPEKPAEAESAEVKRLLADGKDAAPAADEEIKKKAKKKKLLKKKNNQLL